MYSEIISYNYHTISALKEDCYKRRTHENSLEAGWAGGLGVLVPDLNGCFAMEIQTLQSVRSLTVSVLCL